MFSKTGNTVDSAVNQAVHQGVGTNPLVHGNNANTATNQGYGANQGMVGNQGLQGQGYGVNQGMVGSQGLQGQGYGQGLEQQGMYQSQPVANDQTLGHSGLGTVHGFVGQGVSTGLGYHQATVLPTKGNDPQLDNTGTGHRGMFHGHGHTTGAVGTGAAVGAGAGVAAHGKGKGTISFRPIEARFNHDKDLLGKMDPYCKFKIGFHRAKSEVAKGQGVTPTWSDTVTIKHKNQEFAKLKVKDHDKLRHDDTIGTAKIPLDQVLSQGTVDQWVPVSKHGSVTGEVHLIIEYLPRDGGVSNVNTNTV